MVTTVSIILAFLLTLGGSPAPIGGSSCAVKPVHSAFTDPLGTDIRDILGIQYDYYEHLVKEQGEKGTVEICRVKLPGKIFLS